MNDSILVWIQNWFLSNCDGNWEHENIIKIQTLDNPGWSISIDLNYTALAQLTIKSGLIDNAEDDWYTYEIKNAVYKAAGDPNKLEFLLLKFKEIVEANK
jgi:hypothetical protein